MINRTFGSPWGNGKRGSYVPGFGTTENESLVYENDVGQKVIQSAGLVRNADGSLHRSAFSSPSTAIGKTIAKINGGIPTSPDEEFTLRNYLKKQGIGMTGGLGKAASRFAQRSSNNGAKTICPHCGEEGIPIFGPCPRCNWPDNLK